MNEKDCKKCMNIGAIMSNQDFWKSRIPDDIKYCTCPHGTDLKKRITAAKALDAERHTAEKFKSNPGAAIKDEPDGFEDDGPTLKEVVEKTFLFTWLGKPNYEMSRAELIKMAQHQQSQIQDMHKTHLGDLKTLGGR